MAMDFSFKESPRKKRQFKYLSFLPKNLRPLGFYALVFNVANIALAVFFYPSLQEQLPLFYSLPDTQQLVAKENLFILPLVASVINFCHFMIIKSFKNAHQTILHVFILVTNILQILLLAIVLRLILILR